MNLLYIQNLSSIQKFISFFPSDFQRNENSFMGSNIMGPRHCTSWTQWRPRGGDLKHALNLCLKKKKQETYTVYIHTELLQKRHERAIAVFSSGRSR